MKAYGDPRGQPQLPGVQNKLLRRCKAPLVQQSGLQRCLAQRNAGNALQHGLQRGDIVTFWSDELGKLLVKRVVGLPGDKITFQDGYTYINGEMLDESYLPRQGITQCSDSFLVPEGCVFFMGDNRTGSNDARFWKQPYISVDNIRAKVMVGISVLPDNSWRGVRVIH